MADFVTKTREEMRTQMLRVQRAGLIDRGVEQPNLTKDSDAYVRADSLAAELEVLHANLIVQGDQHMPDTATGEALARWGRIVGLTKRPATGSAGICIYGTSLATATLVPTGAQLVDDQGKRYEIETGAALSNGSSFRVVALDAGSDTNRTEGEILYWVAPPIGADPTVAVGQGGLSGGREAETDDGFRERILSRLGQSLAAGNWAHAAALAEEADPAVQKAFVYPAIDGPSTYGIVVLGELTRSSTDTLTRALDSTICVKVADYVNGAMPAHANLRLGQTSGVTVTNANILAGGYSVGLTLPESTKASPPGPGGGWTDATPWPVLAGSATLVYASSVSSPTQFTLTSNDNMSAPTTTGVVAGETTIAWFDRAHRNDDGTFGAMKQSTVMNVSGGVGAVVVEIDPTRPFNGIAVGDYVCPNAENLPAYTAAILAAFNRLGPGEWTSDANRLPRAKRRPLTSQDWPSDVKAAMLRAITNAGDEVLDVSWLYRQYTTPTVPGATTTAPYVIVPSTIGFYRIT